VDQSWGSCQRRIAAGHPEQKREDMSACIDVETGKRQARRRPTARPSSNKELHRFTPGIQPSGVPHEALGMQNASPAVYRPSARKLIRRGWPETGNTQRPMLVCAACRWQGIFFVGKSTMCFLTEVLWGETVGPIAGGRSLVHDSTSHNILLGTF